MKYYAHLTYSIALTLLIALALSCKNSKSKIEAEPLTFEDMPLPVDYLFGFGGDINDDGRVDENDVRLFNTALKGETTLYPEMDVNRDGLINDQDLKFIKAVISGERITLLDVDYMEDDIETDEPAVLSLSGQNFHQGIAVLIDGAYHEPHKLVLGSASADSIYVYFDPGNQIIDSTSFITLDTEKGIMPGLPVHRFGQNIGNNDESTMLGPINFQKMQEPETEEIKNEETDCCISEILFKSHMKGLRIFAYNDSGVEADKSGEKWPLGKNKILRGDARNISIRVFKGKMAIGTYSFNCSTIEKKIYRERFNDLGEGATQVRPLPLFEIVDFVLKQPCEPPSLTFPDSVEVGVVARDNETWDTPDTHNGSGALAKFSVPKSSIEAMGCTKACWVQYVSTGILQWDPNKSEWATLFHSDFHIDNTTVEEEPAWPCYGAQYEEDNRLVLGDGPHIVHQDTLWIGGKRIVLKKGDKILRHSVFISELLCIEPEPRVLATLTWGVHTTYEVDPDDMRVGGATKIDSPKVINFRRIPTPKDRRELKKYLKKKKRDLKKCP